MSRRHRRLPLMRLAWRNTQRNTRRTVLTVTAVAVAVGGMGVAVSVGGMGVVVGEGTATWGAHAVRRTSKESDHLEIFIFTLYRFSYAGG